MVGIQIEIRDNFFYYGPSGTEIWDLSPRAHKLFARYNIEIYQEVPQDDSVCFLIDPVNLEKLKNDYEWEQVSDDRIYIFITDRIELSYFI
jgi:hypothetical protein